MSLLNSLEWIVVLAVVVGLPLAGFWQASKGREPSLTTRLVQIAIVAGTVGLVAHAERIRPEAIGLRLEKPWQLLAISAAATGALILFDLASTRLLLGQPALIFRRLHALRAWDRRARADPLLLALFIIVAAIYEEVLFRGFGFLLAGRLGMGPLLAILPLSIVFGLQHPAGGAGGFVFACLFGFIYACIYLVSGSLYPAIVAHAAGNAFTLFCTHERLLRRIAREPQPSFFY